MMEQKIEQHHGSKYGIIFIHDNKFSNAVFQLGPV